jgi:hypothetical protein
MSVHGPANVAYYKAKQKTVGRTMRYAGGRTSIQPTAATAPAVAPTKGLHWSTTEEI